MHRTKFLFYIFVIIAILQYSLSCTDNPPQIIEVSWQINLCYDLLSGTKYEKLSIFVSADDEDGHNDLDELYIINDELELFWQIDSESWEKSMQGDELWVGTNSFTMPDASSLPPGKYRVLIRDLGGNTEETSITIRNKNITPYTAIYPVAEVEDNKIKITGIYSEYEIWFYDRNAQFITNYPLTGKEIELAIISIKYPTLKDNIMFYLYAHDSNNDCGLITGPYYYTKPLDDDS